MHWIPVEKEDGPAIGGGWSKRATLAKEYCHEGIEICPCGHLRSVTLRVAHLEDDPLILFF